MNKISKKILAIVTMAAFVVTMMPFAAFAAVNDGDYQTSCYKVVDGDQEVYVKEAVATAFEINATGGEPATDISNVKVWATDAQGRVTSAATFYSDEEMENELDALDTGVYNVPEANNTAKVYVAFARDGVYTIHAGVGNYSADKDVDKLDQLSYYDDAKTITVLATEKTVNHVQLNGADKSEGVGTENVILHDGDSATYTLSDSFLVNGIDTYTITGYAYDSANKALRNETFTVETNRGTLDLEEATVTTDNSGKFEIKFSMTAAADYKLYVTNDDIEFTVNVNRADASELDTIENTTSDAKTLLASNDSKYAAQGATNFADAVQFTITKDNGEVATEQSAIAAEPAADKDSAKDHSKYLTVVDKPEKSKIDADDLELIWNAEKEAYTLQYVGTNAKADLIDGEYTVKVALTSGKSAEATFTLAKFGTVQDLAIDMNVLTSGTVANPTLGADITDEVVLGNKVFGTVKYVDENGIEVTANKATVQVGINGAAIESGNTENNLPDFGITTKANTTDNENLLGTVITVTAFDTKVGKMTAAELTVVDGKTANTLAFDSENGEANKTNTVEVSIVDEDGDLVRETGDMYAYIADQSNEDANIEVTPAGTNGVKNGKGDLKIFSDKETSVDVVVAVKVGNAVYAKTLTYTIGEEDINADTTVVMTIGSSDIVVNNDVVTGDAAPFVDSNWRTMVPVRALSQSFGGSAEWDGDARTVTVENGDTTIVFTADSDKYTVNGEEKTMDTALTIVEGRTYVPVKFVAEELGYTVTALKDAQGLTASVVIQK